MKNISRLTSIIFIPVVWVFGKTKRPFGLLLLSTCALALLYGKLYLLLLPGSVTNLCILKEVDFKHKSFAKTFWDETPEECGLWESLVYFDDKGLLQLNSTAVNSSGYADITCWYSTIKFYGENDVILSEKLEIAFPMFVPDEFVHVVCKNTTGDAIYSDLHYKVYSDDVTTLKMLQNETRSQLSVVIVGIDSLSTLVANRMLTRTIPYLQNEMQAYFMNGYTKIGGNTLPNLIAALMGKSLPETVSLLFELPQLFQEIKKRGYVNCYAADMTPYKPNIFLHLPQYTHTLRRFFLAQNKVDLFMKKRHDIPVSRKFEPTSLCAGNRLKHKIVLEYVKQCINSYHNKRKFVLTWINAIGRYQSNYVQLADQDFKSFFRWIKNTKELDKTVVIMMSNHGPLMGPVLSTNLGKLTNLHPFLAIVLPKQLTQRYPHLHVNLITNRYRLTSPFDFHEMLKDIVYQNFGPQGPVTRPLPRGISLFREIPEYRSCYDAAILEDCGCYSYINVSTDSPNVVITAYYAVDIINSFLHLYRKTCVTLSLLKVESANQQYIPSAIATRKDAVRYTVALQTIPGNALFEVTVDFVDKNNIVILERITRRNNYKGQTDCVKNLKYEEFCLCSNNTVT